MDKIDWFYIYSPRYYPFDLYLQDVIPKDRFNPKGIFVDQSVFDEHLYKHEGEHFFSRITVKVETVLRLIQERRAAGNPTPFFFTDVDILVKSVASTHIAPYAEKQGVDMMFQQEHAVGSTVNPGVMLIWPTEASEQFWTKVVQGMKEPGKMEMHVINEVLQTKPVVFETFSIDHVISPITVRAHTVHTFSIYHLLSGSNDRNADMYEKLLQANALVKDMFKYHMQVMEKYGMIYT